MLVLLERILNSMKVIKRIGVVILAILAGIVGGIALAVLLLWLKEVRNEG